MKKHALVAGIVALVGLGAVATLLPRGSRRATSNEISAVASLVVCLWGQHTFHKDDVYEIGKHVFANPSDGRGYIDLFSVKHEDRPQETMIGLIDLQLACANERVHMLAKKGKAPPALEQHALQFDQPMSGYWYVDITGAADGPYDYTREWGLCAYPVRYGASGQLTYIINHDAVVYSKDSGGKPVIVWPDTEAESWEVAEGLE